MKEQNKIPEKELNEMEIANLLGAEFKTLTIKLLREIIEYGKNALAGVAQWIESQTKEYGKNIREEMKATLSEIKTNLQETNGEGKEAGIQIKDLEHKENINIQPEQNEETRIQKKKMRRA